MRVPPEIKTQLLCCVSLMMIMILAFGILPSSGAGNGAIDYKGHLGGFLMGLFAALAIMKPLRQARYE